MEKKIGKNVSSGAKKVEKIEESVSPETVNANAPATKKTVKKTAPDKTAKKTVKKSANGQRKKRVEVKKKAENVAADRRLEKAKMRAEKKEQKLLKKAELKEKKLEKKAALKEKKLEKRAEKARRIAEHKAKKLEKRTALQEKKAERRAEKIARRELLKNESREEKRNRIAREKKERIALKKSRREAAERARERKSKAREAAHVRKANERKEKRAAKNERRKNGKGVGGWIAAVVSLGVACLALATVVTAGSFQMNQMTLNADSGYRATLYEMVSVSEDLDTNLNKLRVATGANEQHRLLTQLLVDTALFESDLERLPVDNATGTDISSFINRTGATARRLLNKLQAGGKLTAEEKQSIARLYEINTKVYHELNQLATQMSAKDLRAFVEGGEGTLKQKFSEIGQGMHEELNGNAPFTGEGNVGKNRLEGMEEISEAQAEELAKTYFADYHIVNVRPAGETLAHGSVFYGFVMTDVNGVGIDAAITKNGGKLAFFDTYERCTQKNFDLETCDSLAREFLNKLGINNVEAVWLSDGGMVANLTYVSNANGVRAYSDMIRIRVCEEKGRVIGMDATGYLFNHHKRAASSPALSEQEALQSLSSELKPYEAHLAIVPVNGEERLVYEIACAMGDEEYLVYVDANSGEELEVFVIRNSAQGRYLR